MEGSCSRILIWLKSFSKPLVPERPEFRCLTLSLLSNTYIHAKDCPEFSEEK